MKPYYSNTTLTGLVLRVSYRIFRLGGERFRESVCGVCVLVVVVGGGGIRRSHPTGVKVHKAHTGKVQKALWFSLCADVPGSL